MPKCTLCAIPECDRTTSSGNGRYCSKHRQRIAKTGTPYRHCKKCDCILPEDIGRRTLCADCYASHRCSVEDCENRPQGRGLCKNHWKRWRRYGDPCHRNRDDSCIRYRDGSGRWAGTPDEVKRSVELVA